MEQAELDKQLIVNAEAGNLEEVNAALAAGANVNAMGPNSGALHCASFGGHKAVVTALIKAGADATIADKQSYVPLHQAVAKDHHALIEPLLKAGAELEAKTNSGGTAMIVAAASNFPKSINALTKHGADLEARDQNDSTPLLVAAGLASLAAVKALIKNGADLNAVDRFGGTPLMKAVESLKTLQIDGWHTAGNKGHVAVSYALKKGAFMYTWGENEPKLLSLSDQRKCSNFDWGPTEHNKYLDCIDCIKLLIKSGCDINHIDNSGRTAFSEACHAGDSFVMKELLKANVKTNTSDEWGYAPLHRVAVSGRPDGLELFLKKVNDYDINATDNNGWTAAMFLAHGGGTESMTILLRGENIDLSAKSTEDWDAFPKGTDAQSIAKHWNDDAMAKWLS